MEKKITGIIFSRDRAMQLDATLRSFFLHCQDADCAALNVIYKATNTQHYQQYNFLANDYKKYGVEFIEEKDFKSNVLDILWKKLEKGLKGWKRYGLRLIRNIHLPIHIGIQITLPQDSNYVLFLVDDNIFVGNFSLATCTRTLENHPNAIGYSLRLGENTVYCYPLQSDQKIPKFQSIEDEILKFRWVGSDKDFGYPLEISSSIYRLSDMTEFINCLQFNNPNQLEEQMASSSRLFVDKLPELICSQRSITFCNPINIVQTVYPNLSGKSASYSSETLADLFAQGRRIKVEDYWGFIPNGCHQEVDLKFY